MNNRSGSLGSRVASFHGNWQIASIPRKRCIRRGPSALKHHPFRKLIIVAIAVMICVVALWSTITRPSGESGEAEPSRRGKGNAHAERSVEPSGGPQTKVEARKANDRKAKEDDRDRALVDLKKKWAEYFVLAKKGGDKKELGRMKWELAKESASRLLTSRQALDLLAFLDDNQAGSEAGMVRRRIEDLFESGRTDELVGPMVEAITQTYDHVEGQYRSDMLGWSFLLGENGSDEDAKLFKESVDGPWPLGDFLHGWNMARAGDDPVGSYTSMVEFLKSGGKGARQGQALENVIRAFPEAGEFDYEALESMLPTGVRGPDAEVYRKARRGILVRWATEEPANAVNYIIEHPERVSADLVTDVVRQAIANLNHDGIEWVRDFPEGVYYDRAAVAVVQKLWDSHPEEAREWARSIGDEQLRATQLRNIESMQRRGTRR